MKFSKTKRSVAIILLVLALRSFAMGSVQNYPRPENTIRKLQNAINDFDLDTFLDCIDSKWSNQIEAICDLSMRERGLSVSSFFDLIRTIMPILPFASDSAIDPKDFPQVDFVILCTEISGDIATIDLAGRFTCGDYQCPFAAIVEMQLENDAWVIAGIR